MQTLKFILQPENVSRVHDALICLSKFSESVSLEARRDKVGIPLEDHINSMSTDQFHALSLFLQL